MLILMTGATGFIGRHLAGALAGAGHEVAALVRPESRSEVPPGVSRAHRVPLSSDPALARLLETWAPEAFIHLAGLTSPGSAPGDFDEHYDHNVRPALDMARVVPPSVRLALFFGSSLEYGEQQVPYQEDMALRCCSPYAWGKIASYFGVTEILSMRGVPCCWARPFLTFGPGPMPSHFIPSVIRGCLEDRRIPLTAGAQVRDFLYVADLCAMVVRMLEHPERARGEVFNLASGVPRTVRSVAERIQGLVGRGDLAFGEIPYRRHEAMEIYGSTRKFDAAFGPVPRTPFDQALAATVEACRP